MSNTQKDNGLPKRPRVAILLSIMMGLGIIYMAFYMYESILQWEVTGGTKRFHWVLYMIYEVFGAEGILVGFILMGLFFFYHAYRLYRKLKS
ncbi:hypothetical protein [Pasteurella sp. PK-2025]|uniref:hypothetical protein n=1 Tax=unclassified Pasteurella TaxID=2621516 RepID=UPI003C730542